MFFRRGHQRWLNRVGSRLKDVEHFRVEPNAESVRKVGAKDHVAVVVGTDGNCFVRKAVYQPVDMEYGLPYKRRRGYDISVGRALKTAATFYENPNDVNPKFHFFVDNELEGRDLRDAVIDNLVKLGLLKGR